MQHLTTRVAWHDSKWDGTVCRKPSQNSYCITLDRIREERNDFVEDQLAGRNWSQLGAEQLPPCVAESAGFMNHSAWVRALEHPYRRGKSTAATHGKLEKWSIKLEPFSTFAVPYRWMLRTRQDDIDESRPTPFPADEEVPFNSPWVFGGKRQIALNEHFFSQLTRDRSLVLFFYTKSGQPIDESIHRLVVGIGRIESIGPMLFHAGQPAYTYPAWERVISHSIRFDGGDGFLLPYHEYLADTGDGAENERRLGLLRELAVTVEGTDIGAFSYYSELVGADVILPTLARSLTAMRLIREHGIAAGPWAAREEWINEQIAHAWEDRGAFPGIGSALEALGLRLGTALVMELLATGVIGAQDDPWPVIDAIYKGDRKPPHKAYEDDIAANRQTWLKLKPERRALLVLLSRFALSPDQAWRWFEESERDQGARYRCTDREILENPYRIVEADLGTADDGPISVGLIDRGLLPDAKIASQHPVPVPSRVGSPDDWRRIRSAVVSVLLNAATKGDSLLSMDEVLERVNRLDVVRAFEIGTDWLNTHAEELEPVLEFLTLYTGAGDERIDALQLKEFHQIEQQLSKKLSARAGRPLPSLGADWQKLLVETINASNQVFDQANERHVRALEEQARALECITTKKLGVLVGRAGTGKTSVLGALLVEPQLKRDGILLLAPTGKARVRLARATASEAMTVAQFLYRQDRYDGTHQRPLLEGEEQHRKQKTVIIDECSMLTMTDLMALLNALDLGHVQRLILVGDPNQLPPIGVGRPFSDLVAHLEKRATVLDDELRLRSEALATLRVEVRARQEGPSDTLRLASWYTREAPSVDADIVLSDLELGERFNDLEIAYWETSEDLRARLLEQFERHLGVKGPKDRAAFDRAVGLGGFGDSFDKSDAIEMFQILSPVRLHPHGVHDLNRWIQRMFRADELGRVRRRALVGLSDEDITLNDKVIQVKNENRKRMLWPSRDKEKEALANGEIGVVVKGGDNWLSVLFANRNNRTFLYDTYDFKGGTGPLELAYALTVHKAQGSEFSKVFVVLPKVTSFISRELVYTALTRSRDQLILLIQGSDASALYDLTRPEKSETGRRNTNLFQPVIRKLGEEVPYAENLIHRTLKGHMVRSKSELTIANILFNLGMPYQYERPFDGSKVPGRFRPDFSFTDPADETIVWEHLGMLDVDTYRQGWERKKRWYLDNGLVEGETLFWTEERRGLDSDTIVAMAEAVKKRL